MRKIETYTLEIGAMCIALAWFALVADIATAQAPVAGSHAVAEVVRLMAVIDEKRGGIEDERATELQSAATGYRENLQAIDPQDMFESEAEYHTRSAREKSEVELQRVASINDIHRAYDDRLRQEVEPLTQRVEELLSSEDIVPRDAIEFHLETYDAESQFFHGILKIDSRIVPTDALISFPMKREDARVFWGNRQSLVPRVRVSLDLWSLSIDLTRFGLNDPESGMTARVFVVPRPPVGQPPTGKAGVVSGFRASARSLADRAPNLDDSESEAKGAIAEYNRLIGEAKGVFADDAYVQNLREIAYHGNEWQAAGAVATAAGGLHAYLTSFVPSDGFEASARALAERTNFDYYYESQAKGLIAEYNRLIGEAKGVFADDAFVQSLREIRYQGNSLQAVGAVATAAGGLHAYLTSFAPSDGFRASARSLADRAPNLDDSESEAKGAIAEYNRLIGEAKGVFADDAYVQNLREIAYHGNEWQAAGAVATAAGGLHAYLTSFVPSDGFEASARALAERTNFDYYYESQAKGLIAEYNRLIGEAKGVFADDAYVQSLREIRYQGNSLQAVEAVSNAARSLARIVANISDVPIALEITEESSGGQGFDYLPYSGRFSENVRSLAKRLRRDFSLYLKDEYGQTDLHRAVSWNLPGLASALLDAGASANARSGANLTPLHYAQTVLVAADLIARGAVVNSVTDSGATPLMYAAWRGPAIAEFLIGQGANVNLKNRDGWTALDYAVNSDAGDVAELLKQHGGACSKKC